jgi:hypothetical protein
MLYWEDQTKEESMAIYMVERTDEIGYDQYESVLVRAKSTKEAKDMVVKRSQWCETFHPEHTESDFGSNCGEFEGLTPTNTHVSKVEPTGESEVLLMSFNAG